MARGTPVYNLPVPVSGDNIAGYIDTVRQAINDVSGSPWNYEGTVDPGAVGSGRTWLDKSSVPWRLRQRNDANSAWELLSGGSSTATTTIGYGGYLLPGLSLLDGLTWAPIFGRHPIVANFVPLRTVTVNSTASWNAAIADQRPGDKIRVTANLTSAISRIHSNKSGTAANPWMIEFAPGVTLSAATPQTQVELLKFTNCDWLILKDLNLTSVNQPLKLRSCDYTFLDSLRIWNIGQEACSWSDHARYFDAWNCSVWDTGKFATHPGEGYYFGTDENAGRWQDPTYSSDLSTYPHAEYISVRQCRFGRDITSEWVEFKAGARYGYAIGNVGDGRGYVEESGSGFTRAQYQAKGSDIFWFWNETFSPYESMFHGYGSQPAGTMGTGSWNERHTYYGNIGHMDESGYTGPNTKYLIRLDGQKGHVVYDNNSTAGSGVGVVVASNGTISLTPTPQ